MQKKLEKRSLTKRSAEKISVLYGINNRERNFPYVDVCEGLVAHQPPDCNKKSRLLNITHKESGLAVIQYVPHIRLPEVISVLSQISWAGDIFDVFNSEAHFLLIKEAVMLSNKERSERQENRIAGDLDGKRQPASGARWGYRRDVITPLFLVEAKTTQQSKFRLCAKDLDFLKKQAYQKGKFPVYIIEMANCAEVAVLPSNDVDPAVLEGMTYVELPSRKTAVSIKESVLKQLTTDSYLGFQFGESQYYLFNYERFLIFSKDL